MKLDGINNVKIIKLINDEHEFHLKTENEKPDIKTEEFLSVDTLTSVDDDTPCTKKEFKLFRDEMRGLFVEPRSGLGEISSLRNEDSNSRRGKKKDIG